MISFRITAPGKVILFGEHAVVYGKRAVAASLNLRSRLDFKELPQEENDILIEMLKLNISKKIPIGKLQKFLSDDKFPKLNDDSHDSFLQSIQKFVESIGFENKQHKSSLEGFFYALFQIIQKENLVLKPFSVKVDTELSIGAGAGSSASFAVCLTTAFLHWSKLQKDSKASAQLDNTELEKISEYAFNCEKIMHGKPSGIDNSICTFGSIIKFRKGEKPEFISPKLKSMKIFLVDTKIGRSTKLLVEKLAGLIHKYPNIFLKIMDMIDDISEQVIKIIKQDDGEKALSLSAYNELSTLIDINQGLLATCQVSHSSLDLICLTAKKYGFSAKLTGAGGGGFAYILIPPDACSIKLQNLSSELTSNKFSVIETDLGKSGVEIHENKD